VALLLAEHEVFLAERLKHDHAFYGTSRQRKRLRRFLQINNNINIGSSPASLRLKIFLRLLFDCHKDKAIRSLQKIVNSTWLTMWMIRLADRLSSSRLSHPHAIQINLQIDVTA
jgi:hypothetical protein